MTIYIIDQNKKIIELEKLKEKIKLLEEKIEKIEFFLFPFSLLFCGSFYSQKIINHLMAFRINVLAKYLESFAANYIGKKAGWKLFCVLL